MHNYKSTKNFVGKEYNERVNEENAWQKFMKFYSLIKKNLWRNPEKAHTWRQTNIGNGMCKGK